MKVLFVCSANKDRSRTAHEHFQKKYPLIRFDSGGTNHKICKKEKTTPLREEQIIWADKVIVMEEKHAQLIEEHTKGKYTEKITILGIPDVYKYGSSDLIQLLELHVNF